MLRKHPSHLKSGCEHLRNTFVAFCDPIASIHELHDLCSHAVYVAVYRGEWYAAN